VLLTHVTKRYDTTNITNAGYKARLNLLALFIIFFCATIGNYGECEQFQVPTQQRFSCDVTPQAKSTCINLGQFNLESRLRHHLIHIASQQSSVTT
jgi:hypothetical protein